MRSVGEISERDCRVFREVLTNSLRLNHCWFVVVFFPGLEREVDLIIIEKMNKKTLVEARHNMIFVRPRDVERQIKA